MTPEPKAPIRVLIVRDAKPVREVRIEPRRIVRLGASLFVAAWLVPAVVLGAMTWKARHERATLEANVAALTKQATALSTNIAELERYAGLATTTPNEGGPGAPTAPEGADLGDATGSFLADLGARFTSVASLVKTRVADSRGTPSGTPVPDARLSSSFGWRANPFTGEGAEWHAGLDFPAPVGTPVLATADGVVDQVGVNGGYGLAVVVRNARGYSTIFGHLQSAAVKAGDAVARGDTVGRVGSGGRSTGPHVHYEVRRDGRPVNPSQVKVPAPSTNSSSR
ncbi:MAG: M23 family metallopeptidase [Gemmatimonadaceae bacterium]|nr:M23 family metallopeptidase [Gemmatimonadaceae bacterium]